MSVPPAKIPYPKPWLSYADQVQLLQQRGLVIANVPAAEQFLSHLIYYRFSGYCLAFESQRHQFIATTTFEQVVEAYDFDLVLRDLLTEALEVVEVDLRAAVAYYFGGQHGAFGHTDPVRFFKNFNHKDWRNRLREEADRSSELFVIHCKQTYSEFPDLPVWIVTEVMSFGALSIMAKGMHRTDQDAVGRRYGLRPQVLQSWTHHLVYVRNLCAHHSRMWDREWAIKPKLPAGNAWQPPLLPGNGRLFSTLLLLRQLMKHIPAVQVFSDQWKVRITDHLVKPPQAAQAAARMGLTTNWHQHPIWA